VPNPTGTDPKYSPGMEGDPNGAILENWSTVDLRSWYEENVQSHPNYREWREDPYTEGLPPGVRDGLHSIKELQTGNSGLDSGMHGEKDSWTFARFGPEFRDRFFLQWSEVPQPPAPTGDTVAEWADPAAVGALITLPDGSRITDDISDPDYEPSGSDGPPPSEDTGDDPMDVEFDSNSGMLPQPWWRTSKAVGWAAAGIVTVALGAGAVTIIGGSDSGGEFQQQDTPDTTAPALTVNSPDTTAASAAPAGDAQAADEQSDAPESTIDSVDDPVGDVSRAFPDLDGVDPDRSVDGYPGLLAIDSADITGLTVVSNADGNTTTIAIGFNGDAQGINTEESGTLMSRSLGGDVLITPSEGRILNVLFRRDGTIKISDIPSGMSITSEWLTPGEFLIVITGLALNPGTQVEAIVLLEAYGGFMSDVVGLLTTNP